MAQARRVLYSEPIALAEQQEYSLGIRQTLIFSGCTRNHPRAELAKKRSEARYLVAGRQAERRSAHTFGMTEFLTCI